MASCWVPLVERGTEGGGDAQKFSSWEFAHAQPGVSDGSHRTPGTLAVVPTVLRLEHAPAQMRLFRSVTSVDRQEEARHGDDDPHRERARRRHRHPERGPGKVLPQRFLRAMADDEPALLVPR
jgi:hypothetical protein